MAWPWDISHPPVENTTPLQLVSTCEFPVSAWGKDVSSVFAVLYHFNYHGGYKGDDQRDRICDIIQQKQRAFPVWEKKKIICRADRLLYELIYQFKTILESSTFLLQLHHHSPAQQTSQQISLYFLSVLMSYSLVSIPSVFPGSSPELP